MLNGWLVILMLFSVVLLFRSLNESIYLPPGQDIRAKTIKFGLM